MADTEREAIDTLILQSALRLCEARFLRDAARKELREFREERGSCLNDCSESGGGDPCYRSDRISYDEWCQVCRDSQPIYCRRSKAADNVGAATRQLMKLYTKRSEA